MFICNSKNYIDHGASAIVFRYDKDHIIKIHRGPVEKQHEYILREFFGVIIYDDSLPILGVEDVLFENDGMFPQEYITRNSEHGRVYGGIIRKYLPNKINKKGNQIRDWFDGGSNNIRSNREGRNYIIDTNISGYCYNSLKNGGVVMDSIWKENTLL